MKKINIAELLRNCPKGMELDCPMYNKVTLLDVDNNKVIIFPIRILREDGNSITLTKYGQCTDADFAKCVIFPKGKTTWEGFVPPVKFKDGDIITMENEWGVHIFIYNHTTDKYNDHGYYAILTSCGKLKFNSFCNGKTYNLSNEEEKKKLFKAIKDNGYKWNPETKNLENLIEPYFKIGDKIRHKNDKTIIKTINYIYHDSYALCDNHLLYFKEQDEWELVPNKFDVTTLKPFDKVLVRDFDNETWEINFFSKLLDGKHFKCLDLSYIQCIPFEGNEHLYDTTNKCDEFYRNWKS